MSQMFKSEYYSTPEEKKEWELGLKDKPEFPLYREEFEPWAYHNGKLTATELADGEYIGYAPELETLRAKISALRAEFETLRVSNINKAARNLVSKSYCWKYDSGVGYAHAPRTAPTYSFGAWEIKVPFGSETEWTLSFGGTKTELSSTEVGEIARNV